MRRDLVIYKFPRISWMEKQKRNERSEQRLLGRRVASTYRTRNWTQTWSWTRIRIRIRSWTSAQRCVYISYECTRVSYLDWLLFAVYTHLYIYIYMFFFCSKVPLLVFRGLSRHSFCSSTLSLSLTLSPGFCLCRALLLLLLKIAEKRERISQIRKPVSQAKGNDQVVRRFNEHPIP